MGQAAARDRGEAPRRGFKVRLSAVSCAASLRGGERDLPTRRSGTACGVAGSWAAQWCEFSPAPLKTAAPASPRVRLVSRMHSLDSYRRAATVAAGLWQPGSAAPEGVGEERPRRRDAFEAQLGRGNHLPAPRLSGCRRRQRLGAASHAALRRVPTTHPLVLALRTAGP